MYVPLPGISAYFGKLNGTPYSDVRVRKAISHAIDRHVIAEKTLHGSAAPASGPIMPSIQWANKNLKGYSYNPEKAKSLLAEAGWKDVDGDGILEKMVKSSASLYILTPCVPACSLWQKQSSPC